MINVRIYVNSEDDIEGFCVKGHAGAGTEGNDIVCSAVSTVAYTVIGSLQELAGIDGAEIKEGLMKFRIPTDILPDKVDLVSVIFAVMEVGFQQIAASYGSYVKVEYKEV